jgi:hypothetical protein
VILNGCSVESQMCTAPHRHTDSHCSCRNTLTVRQNGMGRTSFRVDDEEEARAKAVQIAESLAEAYVAAKRVEEIANR